jgi:hypothetical protein
MMLPSVALHGVHPLLASHIQNQLSGTVTPRLHGTYNFHPHQMLPLTISLFCHINMATLFLYVESSPGQLLDGMILPAMVTNGDEPPRGGEQEEWRTPYNCLLIGLSADVVASSPPVRPRHNLLSSDVSPASSSSVLSQFLVRLRP